MRKTGFSVILGLFAVAGLVGCPAAGPGGLGAPSGASVDGANENAPDVVAAATDKPHSGGVTALPSEHEGDAKFYFAMDGTASFACADPLLGVTYHVDVREANVSVDDPTQRRYLTECRPMMLVRFMEGEGDTLHCEDLAFPGDCHAVDEVTLKDAANVRVYVSIKAFPGSLFPGHPDLSPKPSCEETSQQGSGFMELRNEIAFLAFEKTDDQPVPPACRKTLIQFPNGIPGGLPDGAQTITVPLKDLPKIPIELK